MFGLPDSPRTTQYENVKLNHFVYDNPNQKYIYMYIYNKFTTTSSVFSISHCPEWRKKQHSICTIFKFQFRKRKKKRGKNYDKKNAEKSQPKRVSVYISPVYPWPWFMARFTNHKNIKYIYKILLFGFSSDQKEHWGKTKKLFQLNLYEREIASSFFYSRSSVPGPRVRVRVWVWDICSYIDLNASSIDRSIVYA